MVEVEEKPVDVFARIDNRGTKARGPLQYFSSISLNNLGRMHESLTLSHAGAFQTTELQYWMLSYRQVLTREGLTLFANNSYSRSKPGTEILRLLEYKTRGDLFEAGLSYPFIRSREKNLIATGLFFISNDRTDILGALNTLDRIRGVRIKVDADFVDPLRATNQINLVLSQGIEGLGGSSSGGSIPVAGQRAARLHQVRGDLQPPAAAAGSKFFRAAGRLYAVGKHPPALAGAVRLWRPRVRAGLRPLRAGRRPLRRAPGGAALRHPPFPAKYLSISALYLRRPRLAP